MTGRTDKRTGHAVLSVLDVDELGWFPLKLPSGLSTSTLEACAVPFGLLKESRSVLGTGHASSYLAGLYAPAWVPHLLDQLIDVLAAELSGFEGGAVQRAARRVHSPDLVRDVVHGVLKASVRERKAVDALHRLGGPKAMRQFAEREALRVLGAS